VSIVLDVGLDQQLLVESLRTVAAQTTQAWDLVAVDRGGVDRLHELLDECLGADRHTVIAASEDALAQGAAEAVSRTSGRYLAFLRAGDTWAPDRLRLLSAVASERSAPVVVDDMRQPRVGAKDRFVTTRQADEVAHSRLASVDVERMLLDRELVQQVGGVDPTMRGKWYFELVLRLAAASEFEYVPVLGVVRPQGSSRVGHLRNPAARPPVDHARIQSWADVAINRHAIDWAGLDARERRAGVVSVIVPTYNDSVMTWAAVEALMASDGIGGIEVECIVWDNGSVPWIASVLDALPLRFPSVKVHHSPINHGFALGNNLAFEHATGELVVFLNNDTTMPPEWLVPIVAAMEDPTILGVQSLLIYPSGAVQSAGVVFPTTGGLPYAFLQGFPVEDAQGIEQLEFAALTGAAMAIRSADATTLRGFDPIFRNGLEDVDLSHRLLQLRSGTLRVLPEQPVVHHESRTVGRHARYAVNRDVYLERWAGTCEPRDDGRKWATRGFRVVDHDVKAGPDSPRRWLLVPSPVLVREARLSVRETPPRLRWALKNPAPAGVAGETWGDTHFARATAGALRALGQEVVIDHRMEFARSTSRHDDVALVLRGIVPFQPSPEQVSIGWVISHPEMMSWQEAASYDRLMAASVAWAASASERWRIRVDPLLQATDPELFHPDRAVPDTGHPVLFVGSSRHNFRPVVRDAVEAGLPLSLYGDAWRKFIPARYIKAEYLANHDLGAAYRGAGVVLNDHWEDMRVEGFLSNRLFDAVASGARVITDDVTGLREVFGDSVQVYRTPEDLSRLSSLPDPAAVFGDDESIRAEAARIAREHSFRARAEQLVAVAIEERRRRGFES
jgi:GT2 family glycosyltransferase